MREGGVRDGTCCASKRSRERARFTAVHASTRATTRPPRKIDSCELRRRLHFRSQRATPNARVLCPAARLPRPYHIHPCSSWFVTSGCSSEVRGPSPGTACACCCACAQVRGALARRNSQEGALTGRARAPLTGRARVGKARDQRAGACAGVPRRAARAVQDPLRSLSPRLGVTPS